MNRKVILFYMIIFIFLISFFSTIKLENFTKRNNNKSDSEAKLKLSIGITGNSELNDTATSGNGTKANPFIIENYILDGEGIAIFHTNKYFILRGCTISNVAMGIQLFNVTNGNIIDNTLYKHSNAGIWIQSSENNSISNNKCYDNFWGLVLIYSDYNNISGNELRDGEVGTQIQSSDYNRVHENLIKDNDFGIYFYDANYNNATYNRLYYNEHAIFELACTDNIIEPNDIKEKEDDSDDDDNIEISGYNWIFIFLGIIAIISLKILLYKKFRFKN